ncbi:MAG: magnesium transporter [Bdellovibrionales bacterium]|nr:magnesium transporter [Bdellovibrionales bacterium]
MGVFNELSDSIVNFCEVVATPIYNHRGERIGRMSDLFADYEESYPTVLAILFRQNRKSYYLPWEVIKSFSCKRIVLTESASPLSGDSFPKRGRHRQRTNILSAPKDEEIILYPALGKVILDRQIVDTFGKKVVRVNDIQLLKVGQKLRVTHAAIGLRSMFRRLGMEGVIDSTIKRVKPDAEYLSKTVLIDWKHVHAISDPNAKSTIRLGLTNEEIEKIHPADLADILEDLDLHGREQIFSNLDPKIAAETLSEVELDLQASLIINEDPDDAAKIIENMGTDEAADLLHEMGEQRAEKIISEIEDDRFQEEVVELLEHEEHTAGGLMSTEVFKVTAEMKKSEILQLIQDESDEFDSIYDIFIVNNHHDEILEGTCSLKRLLVWPDDIHIGDIMKIDDIKSLTPEMPWKEVAATMSKYNMITAPVIDERRELLGSVSVDDLLPWLLHER